MPSWVNNIPYTYRQWRQQDNSQVQLYHKKLLFIPETYQNNKLMYKLAIHKWDDTKKHAKVPKVAKYFDVPIEASHTDYCASWTAWFSSNWIPINCSQSFKSASVICQFDGVKTPYQSGRLLRRSKAECTLDAFAISSYCIRIQEIASSGAACPYPAINKIASILIFSNIFRRYMGLYRFTNIGIGEYTTSKCQCYIQSPHTMKSETGGEPLERRICSCKRLDALLCANFKTFSEKYRRY